MNCMSFYDLYAIEAESLAAAKSLVEALLSCSFEERDSSFHGGTYYHWGEDSAESYMLKVNRDPFENEPAESDFPHITFLLYVNDTTQSAELQKAMAKGGFAVSLLRHEDLS